MTMDVSTSINSLNTLPFPIQIFLLISTLHLLNTIAKPLFSNIKTLLEFVFLRVPTITVPLEPTEANDEYTAPRTPEPNAVTRSLRDPKFPNTIQCYDPSTLQHLGSIPALTPAQVEDLCQKAKRAQVAWARTTYPQRRLVLRTIQKYILSHMDEITRVCVRDSGKPRVDALLGEIMVTCEKIRWVNASGERALGRSIRETSPIMMHKRAYVEYVPLGVIGVIAPWNYPFHNMLNHIISGLFSGNAVVSKVSEHTSWSSSYFTKIVKMALEVNGHDSDVVQTITGFGDAGRALVECKNVDKIIFTGSPGVGKMIMEGCSKSLKPCILELGGKDPMVFCDDVKIESVIPFALRGCYQSSGQNCCGVERLFVYESILSPFLAKILPHVKALRQGIPLTNCGSDGNVDCGAMVMDTQIDHIQSLIDDAVSAGATLHCGGKRNSTLKGGQFYEPTVISGVTTSMRISQEEVFGPVMCIVTVPNDSDDECVHLVNDCPFGLGSSVYSSSQNRGMKIGQQIRSGVYTVNDFGSNYMIQSLPFGGVKDSGFGKFAGKEGLRACCLERTVAEDKIWGIKTSIPPALSYPINVQRAVPFAQGLLKMFYSESLIDKLKGIISLIKHS